MTEQPVVAPLPLQGTLPQNGQCNEGERKVITSLNPATNAVLGEVHCATPDDILEAMQRARAAQPAWGALPLEKRIDFLRALKKSMYQHHEALLEVLTNEAGKIAHESRMEMMAVMSLVDYYIRHAKKILKPHADFVLLTPHRRQQAVRRPYGVVVIISPWNFPLMLSMTSIMTALVAGNSVIFKPSEYSTQMGELIARIIKDAGFPQDVFQVMQGYGDVGAGLIDARPDKICFTGSETTGRKIGAKAGEYLIPVTLELGGKDAAIVLADANIDRTALGLVWAGTLNAGQACLSVERVYVIRSVSDQLIERMKDYTEKYVRPGPANEPRSTYGAIITEPQLKIIQRQVEDARQKGANVMTFSETMHNGSERFFAPTLITDVTDDMEVMTRETFGPVIPIVPVDSEEEAIRLTNDSPYGLTASVWTEDKERGKAIAAKLQVGMVSINDHFESMSTPNMPWGGVKASGNGRTRGVEGLLDMTYVQAVSTERFRLPLKLDPFWLPYTPLKRSLLGRFVHLWFGTTWQDRLKAFRLKN